MGSQARLVVELQSAAGSDDIELAEVADQLRRALLDLEVDSVDGVSDGAVPDRAKAVDPTALGTLAVTMAPLALRSVVDLVKTWLSDRQLRTVTLTMDGDTVVLSKASRSDQHDALQAFLRRHGDEHGTA